MERQHLDTLPTNASQCLGDFCDVLGCPSWVESQKRLPHGSSCDGRQLDARRHFCQHLLHDCIPQHSEMGSFLFASLDAQLCGRLSCKWRQRLRAGAVSIQPVGLPEDAAESSGTLYYVVAGMMVLLLACLYLAIFCWHRETKTGNADLRPRRNRRGGGYLEGMRKSKVY